MAVQGPGATLWTFKRSQTSTEKPKNKPLESSDIWTDHERPEAAAGSPTETCWGSEFGAALDSLLCVLGFLPPCVREAACRNKKQYDRNAGSRDSTCLKSDPPAQRTAADEPNAPQLKQQPEN